MRLIDADALLERMKKAMESGRNLNGTFDLHIEHAPTVSAEAVEVVRCKDCKDYDGGEVEHEYERCRYFWSAVEEDDFCSYGEKRR